MASQPIYPVAAVLACIVGGFLGLAIFVLTRALLSACFPSLGSHQQQQHRHPANANEQADQRPDPDPDIGDTDPDMPDLGPDAGLHLNEVVPMEDVLYHGRNRGGGYGRHGEYFAGGDMDLNHRQAEIGENEEMHQEMALGMWRAAGLNDGQLEARQQF
jgi:hypothetical protein